MRYRNDNGLKRLWRIGQQVLQDVEDPVPTYEEARVASLRESRAAMIDDYVVSSFPKVIPSV